MYEEFENKSIIKYIVLGTIFIGGLIVLLKLSYINTLKYTLLLSLLYSAFITDYRSKDIVGLNIYLMYLYVGVFLFIDFTNGDNVIFKISICLITYLICKALNYFKLMGNGDNSIMIIIVYTFEYYSLLVFGMACLISLILGVIRHKKEVFKSEVALAPGLFLAVISIGYLLLYQYIKITNL
jgi:hypothetical protein